MKVNWTDIQVHYSHDNVKFLLVCTRFHNDKATLKLPRLTKQGHANWGSVFSLLKVGTCSMHLAEPRPTEQGKANGDLNEPKKA